jgi:hypothetical protein
MSFSSWLANRNSPQADTRRRAPAAPRKRAPFRPRLEVLESRDVPTTLYVTTALDPLVGVGDGSLRGELGAAQSGDTVKFAIPKSDPGYNPTTGAFTITLSRGWPELQIGMNVTIQGPGAGQLTISGGGNVRVFEIDGVATTVHLSGLTISGGNGVYSSSTFRVNNDGHGGAIWNGGVLTICDCAFSNNFVDQEGVNDEGGAIYNAGTLAITDSVFSNNQAGITFTGAGGAIANAGNLTVSNSMLMNNAARWAGGAIYNPGSLSVSGGAISGNSAIQGGGIFNGTIFEFNKNVTAALTGVTLMGNTASDGGAIWNIAATMSLSSTTASTNTATDAGGGIYNASKGHLTILAESMLTGNSAPVGLGGDLYNLGATKISKDSTVGVIDG